jgi:beta-lactam-binding protein with PASTA domain
MIVHKLRDLFFSFLWLMPFLSFVAGYQFIRLLTHTETIRVPAVVGLHMNEAIKILSTDLLNVRILAEKEDPDLHEGTILSQMPEAGQQVKTHQSIFLVVTKRPPELRAPHCIGLTVEEVQRKASALGITLTIESFESSIPKNRIISQSIMPDREVNQRSLMLYNSEGSTPMRIFPDLKGRLVEEVVPFFTLYNATVQIQGDKAKPIREQHPRAGTLVDIRKPLTLQVICSEGQ